MKQCIMIHGQPRICPNIMISADVCCFCKLPEEYYEKVKEDLEKRKKQCHE